MEKSLFQEMLRMMKKYDITEGQVAAKMGVPAEKIIPILRGAAAPGDYEIGICAAIAKLYMPLAMKRSNEALAALNKKLEAMKKNANDGKEVEHMAAKEFLTDEQVEREIERLRVSPQVALARREARIRYRRRQYLYQLRDLEKKGFALEKAGITMDVLNGLAEEETYDDPC